MAFRNTSATTIKAPVRRVEQLMVVMWFVVTFTVFKNDELILYPLALYFFYAFFRHRDETFPILIRCWPLLLLPVWAVLTSPYAVVPNFALRASIQMVLTVQVSVLLCVWLRPRTIILTVLAATGICGILSIFITSYHDGAMTGIFAHKNMLGAKMLLLWSSSLCVALDHWMKLWIRVIAFGLSALALALILASHSATALVLALIVVFLIGGFSFFAGRGNATPMDRIALGLIIIGTLGISVPSLVAVSPASLFGYLLESLGKSSTLTGRTELWAYAEDVIRLRPWIGHGSAGFWRYEENDLVRQIFAEFHKSPNQVFSFHNSYYEVSVNFGLIGLGLTIFTVLWAFSCQLIQLAVRGGMPFIFFPTVASVELVRSFVESSLMKPFLMANMLIWIGAIFLIKYPIGSHPD